MEILTLDVADRKAFKDRIGHNVSYSGAACPICSGRHRNVADECFAGAADSFFRKTCCQRRNYQLFV